MKRFLSAIFAAVLLLTMLPFGAFAAEDKSSERDKLIAQACEVFPILGMLPIMVEQFSTPNTQTA